MTKAELIAIIEEVIESTDYAYNHYGVRTQEEEFSLGPITHLSKVWDDGDETEEELDGICATDAENHSAVAMHCSDNASSSHYFGGHIAILGCNNCDYGEDYGEIIMRDADVLRIIK